MNSAELQENIEDVFPMSDIEKGMIFYYLKKPDIYYYQDVVTVRYESFDAERFRKALELMVEKHSILRTAFIIDEFAQLIFKKVPVLVWYKDISAMEKSKQQRYIKNYLSLLSMCLLFLARGI